MSDVQLGIKITADSKGAVNELEKVHSSTTKLSRDAGALHAGWAKLNNQFARQTAAKAWTNQLGQVSQAAQKLKQSIDNTTQAWAKLSQQGMQRLEATAWANRLAQSTMQATKAIDEQTNALKRQGKTLSDTIGLWTRMAGGLFIAQQAWSQLRRISHAADIYTNLNSRLKLVSITTQELTRAQQASFDVAQRYNMGLDDTGRLYTRLAPIAQNLGRSQTDLITLMSGVGAAMKVSGATAAEASSTITQLTQSLAAATVQGSDFNLLYDTAPAIVRAVEKELSVLVRRYGSLKNALEKGAVSNQQLFDVLVKTSPEFQRQADTMRTTVGGALQNLSNAWTKYIGDADQAKGSSKDLADGLKRLADNLETVMYIPAKIISGWGLLADGIEKVVKSTKELFSLQPNVGTSTQLAERQAYIERHGVNQAVTKEDLEARKKQQQEYFSGIKQGAESATAAMRGLSDEQQRVANQIINSAKSEKVDPALALAIAQTESRFNQRARSPDGAIGVMQLMPGTARGLGVNPANEQENIQGGIKHIKQLQGEFKTLTQIAAAYNAGPGNVRNDKWLRFAETRDYVEKVTAAYQRFKTELGDEGEFNVAREQFDGLREETKRYLANLDDQAKATQRQSEITISGIDNQIAALDRERDTWNKAQDDKIDAANGSYDTMAQLEAERATKLQDYAARELALIQQQFDARKRAMEAAAGAYQKQLANPNLTDDEERRAKQGLADIQADLVKLANERAQAEAKAGQSAIDASRGSLELAQKQKDFIADINAELEFQKQLYLQIKAAKEAGASAEGLAIIRATAEQSRQLPGMISQAEIQRTEQAIAQQKIYEQQLDDITQKQQDQSESVREQQLRENAYWDQLINRMEQYADTWREITGVQNDAFSRLAIQTNQYAKSINQIGKAYEDMNKTQGDPAGVLGIAEGAAQAQAALNLMAQTMLALRSQYKEGTQGYEDMTAAAERMMEVQRALQLVEAVLGVVHQATAGDPYTAIPRMIGMAAMMASMGLQTGAGGSAKASVKYAAQPGQQDSGVFGDPSKASDSIAKSLAIIRDNSSNDLNYSAAMLRALEGIEAAMKGVTNTVIRGVAPASIAGLGSKVPEGMNTFNKVMNTLFFGPAGFFAADFLNKALAPLTKILFNVTRKISDFGIAASQQALSDILTKGFSGQVYTDIETTTKVLGITVSKSVKTVFSDMDPTIAREFTRAFESIRRAVIEGGKAFGLTATDFNQRLKGFVVDMGKISTKDMTGEQLQEKITQMFSEQSDRIARRFMPKLGPFQQVGEGYFYTFARVAEAVNRAGGELERLGIKAIDFRDKAIDKQAPDLAAEIFRQSVIQAEGMSSVAALMKNATGTLQEMKDYFTTLLDIRQSMRTANLQGDMTEAELNRAGGANAYREALNTYLDKFLTPGENLIGQWQNIGDAFTALGLKMPTTNAEFRALVEGIDTSTEAGQKLRGAVLALAPGFADLTSAMDDAKSALQSAYDTAKQQAQGLRDYLNSLKTGQDTGGSVQERYQAAKALYEETLRNANAGDPEAIAKLREASASFLDLSKQYFGATAQYATDLASVQTGLGGLADSIEKQVKAAEDQYTWLKDNTKALDGLAKAMRDYETTMAKVHGIQSSQTGQSVDDINAGNNAEAKAKAEKEAKAAEYEKRLKEMVRDLRHARSHDQNKLADRIKDEIDAYIADIQSSGIFTVTWNGRVHDVSYRAQGGYTPPGLTLVGEEGPELVRFTHPAHVHPAEETARLLRDKSAPEVPYPDWMSMMKVADIQTRASGGYTPPGLTLVGEEGPELVRFVSPSNIYTAQQTKEMSGDKIDTSRIEERLESLERAIGAGLKIDQSGYQVLRAELQGLRAELAEQTRAVKLSAMS